jgi:exonuclease SbcC
VREQVEALREALAAAQQHRDRLATAAAGVGAAEAQLALHVAGQELARSRAAGESLVALDAAVAELDAAQREHQTGHAEALAGAAAAGAELVGLEAALVADQEAVAAACAEHPSVAERLATQHSLVSDLALAEQAAGALAVASAAHDSARAACQVALAREGFADATQARAAQLPADEATALAEQVREHDEERAAVGGILADPELAGLDPDEAIDPGPTGTALTAARTAHDQATAAWGRASARLAEAASRAAAVRSAVQERAACRRATEPLLAVATLASGRNVLAMDLATYVLQRRFDLVVAAANEHLRVMSDGALALASTDEAEGRARRAGLGLRVLDLRTGQERSPRTLSGGETFYTALALALGLASVVTGEAGGVDLGTLFVDEGFGSLDNDTLDDVLAVLTSLRSGGRVIGVVSHVEEMKQRIPERIEVRRDDVAGHSAIRVVA